jgi:hypothetical protein
MSTDGRKVTSDIDMWCVSDDCWRLILFHLLVEDIVDELWILLFRGMMCVTGESVPEISGKKPSGLIFKG